MKRVNKTNKLAFALAMASTAPLVAYSLYGSLEESRATLNSRILSCEQFSLLCALSVQRDDPTILKKISSDLLERDKSLGGIRIIRNDGVQICDLVSPSITKPEEFKEASLDNRISATLYRLQQPWGNVDFYYSTPPQRDNNYQVFVASSLAIAFNLLVFALILRRSLSVLDTTKVVPTRVRNTLNTIPDGVVIVDKEGRVIVANEAFQNSTEILAQELIGSDLSKIPFTPMDSDLPWTDPEKASKTMHGVKAVLTHPSGDRFFTVGCSPIFDSQENHAGNLVSFQDITELEHQKRKIECTLKELGESKEQLRQQNEKLHELASKDMLTGVFNRRSLFEHLENIWNMTAQEQQSMSVVMLDVDHFKKLNDGHGHAVGDQVLRDVAAVLRESAPERSMVARYGGEEFCVVLPLMELSHAAQAAETIRRAIQRKLETPYQVTASFGVASNLSEVTCYQMLLDRADKALYSSKHRGRNTVTCWSEFESQEQEKSTIIYTANHPSQELPTFPEATSTELDLAVLVQELSEISPMIQNGPRANVPTDAGNV